MLFGGNVDLFKSCRRAGIETSIDVNWDPRWNGGLESADVRKRIEAVIEALPLVNYVHGNERGILSSAEGRP